MGSHVLWGERIRDLALAAGDTKMVLSDTVETGMPAVLRAALDLPGVSFSIWQEWEEALRRISLLYLARQITFTSPKLANPNSTCQQIRPQQQKPFVCPNKVGSSVSNAWGASCRCYAIRCPSWLLRWRAGGREMRAGRGEWQVSLDPNNRTRSTKRRRGKGNWSWDCDR